VNDPHDLARFFKALGDETRLRLVALLAQQRPGEALCVGRLATELQTTASNASQHLRVLKDLGLVRGERRGYSLHYFLRQEQLTAYRDLARALLGAEFFAAPCQQEEVNSMSSNQKCECTQPEKERNPQECTPDQIRECHGEVEEHPCEAERQSDR